MSDLIDRLNDWLVEAKSDYSYEELLSLAESIATQEQKALSELLVCMDIVSSFIHLGADTRSHPGDWNPDEVKFFRDNESRIEKCYARIWGSS